MRVSCTNLLCHECTLAFNLTDVDRNEQYTQNATSSDITLDFPFDADICGDYDITANLYNKEFVSESVLIKEFIGNCLNEI